MEPPKKYCECSRSIRIRIFAWKADQALCKSRNVWTGFDAATGDILMILDADLTTMPEELPYFLDVIASGQAEFVNGSRLVYPVPKGAMNTANMLGNKFFSVAFTYLLGQRVKDTLVRHESALEK